MERRTKIACSSVAREVSGFAELDPRAPSWNYGVDGHVIWDGMTAEGSEALQKVLRESLVALCHAHPLLYLLEGQRAADPNWHPVMLAPAHLANVQGKGRLFLLSSRVAEGVMQQARAAGEEANWRWLEAA